MYTGLQVSDLCGYAMVGITRACDKPLNPGMERFRGCRVPVQLNQVIIEFLLQGRANQFIFKVALKQKSADRKQTAKQRTKQQGSTQRPPVSNKMMRKPKRKGKR